MYRLKLFGLALLSVVAAGVVTASTASANLAETPEFSVFPNKITAVDKVGVLHLTVLGSALTVLCGAIELSPGTVNEVTSATHGKFDILFLECKSNLGTTCTGLNDTVKGSILAKGEFLLRYKTITELKSFIKLEPSETHFECGIGLVTVRGSVCGPITPEKSKTKDFTLDLKSTKTNGDQLFTQISNAKHTANEACGLESESNGGAFTMSAEEAVTILLTEKEAEILTQ